MNKKTIAIIIAVIIGCVGVVGVNYNSLVSKEQAVETQYSVVESKLQRRFDLIPNLVNAVKGSMAQEEKIFTAIADSRAKLAGANTVDEKIAASSELESSLSRLLMVVENYPELKSNENVKSLMDELAGTENRVSVERDRLQEVIKKYNNSVKKFPSNIFANMFGFEEKPYFQATEGANSAPVVDLTK